MKKHQKDIFHNFAGEENKKIVEYEQEIIIIKKKLQLKKLET